MLAMKGLRVQGLRLLALFFYCVFAPLSDAAGAWFDDLNAAKKAAAAQKKDLLILYKGDMFFKDEYKDRTDNYGRLIESPYFTDEARKKYVLVEQKTPPRGLDKNGEPNFIPSAVYFCDAQGRPYYEVGGFKNGLDWVLQDLELAQWRKAVVTKILNKLDVAKGEDVRIALYKELFKELPLGVEKFYAPYRAWADKLDAVGDSTIAERERIMEDSSRVRMDIAAGLKKIRGMDDLNALLGRYSAEFERIPELKQEVAFMVKWLLINIAMQGRDDEEIQSAFKQAIEETIAMAPHSRLTCHLKAHGGYICAIPGDLIKLHAVFGDPAKAMPLMAELENKYDNYYIRQIMQMLKGRMLVEQGKWKEAGLAYEQAIKLNPIGEQSDAAKKAMDTLRYNGELLQELFERKNKGNEGIDRLWKKLVSVSAGVELRAQGTGQGLEFKK